MIDSTAAWLCGRCIAPTRGRAAGRARWSVRYGGAMVFAISEAMKFNIGVVGVFFVLFPVLVQGLIAYAAAGAYAERRDNDYYLEQHRIPGSEV